MKILIFDKKKTDKLKPVVNAMYIGLKTTGFDVAMNTESNIGNYDISVCWGWRRGTKEKAKNKRVLVMEHGYMINRHKWISLGWDGLNNNANFLNEDVSFDRWNDIFREHMKPWKFDGEYILFCGQVPGDMSLNGKILVDWYIPTAQKASKEYRLPVVWRPHPLDKFGSRIKIPKAKLDVKTPLTESLKKAAAIMAFNSNSLIDGVMSGVPPIAFDKGTMTWDLCAKNYEPLKRLDREDWGRKMAYTQWSLDEIENGTAIKHIFKEYL